MADDGESCVPFYEIGANIHMSLKNSKDGKEKDEIVDSIKGMFDELKPFRGGFPLIEALEEQKRPRVEQ